MLSAIHTEAGTLLILLLTLSLIYFLSEHPHPLLRKFFGIVPPLLLAYFIPAILNWPVGWLDPEKTQIQEVTKNYFLPASLVLLCLTIDLKAVAGLGKKAIIMFLAASVGVIVGGPLALWLTFQLFPDTLAQAYPELWKGLSTIAGSWIGGSANQAAMKEIYNVPDDLFGSMIVVDVFVSYVWMAILLYGSNHSVKIDRWLRADTRTIEILKNKSVHFDNGSDKQLSVKNLVYLMTAAFGTVAFSHVAKDLIMPLLKPWEAGFNEYGLNSLNAPFFWLILISSTLGLIYSVTPLHQLKSKGATEWGTFFLYFMVTTIGMQMNISKIFSHPQLMWIGVFWILFHAVFIIAIARLIRAPFFLLAVGSQANIGGPASAPVVASAFDPTLAPVGVLLAVMGYAIGTYGAMLCAQLMSWL